MSNLTLQETKRHQIKQKLAEIKSKRADNQSKNWLHDFWRAQRLKNSNLTEKVSRLQDALTPGISIDSNLWTEKTQNEKICTKYEYITIDTLCDEIANFQKDKK